MHHFSIHLHIPPVDAHRACAAGQRGTACAGCLVASQDDHVAVVAGVVRQVVQYAPTSGHAACRQDDHGAVAGGQGARLIGTVDHRRAMGQRVALRHTQAMLPLIVFKQMGGMHGHRAVQKDRE